MNKTIISNLGVYSFGHALIDAVSAAVVFSIGILNNLPAQEIVLLIITYNVIAFSLQALIGFAVDTFRFPKLAAIIGCVLAGISTLTIGFPWLTVILVGLGNAFFHVGGGVISLNLNPGKATFPGIFVSTGAIGLLIGVLIGKSGNFNAVPFILLLLFLVIAIKLVKPPAINYEPKPKANFNRMEIIVVLLLVSIAIRGMVGTLLKLPWKSDFNLLLILTIAVVLGKALGGIFADKFGWIKVSVSCLLLSAPLLFLGPNYAILGILGAFLFNFTMPVTLTALSNTLPGKAGFAFGLTTLALIIGAFISYTPLESYLSEPLFILIIILISSVLLFKGLKIYLQDYSQAWGKT